jgi:heme/copper-type cytochrome/quinol oxidase subunit 2
MLTILKQTIQKFTPHSFQLHQGLVINLFRNIYFSVFFFLIVIHAIFKTDYDFYANAFKDPASPVMEGIIDFHHDVFFYLIIILIFISWFLIRILTNNIISDDLPIINVTRFTKPSEMQLLEFIWTLIPTLILFAIAIPSFTLLYAMNELITPAITVKVTGLQWYWNYEITDRVFLPYEDE